MTDFAREVRTGAPAGFLGLHGRGRVAGRAVPVWMRMAVILGVSVGLWAAIIASLQGLFAL